MSKVFSCISGWMVPYLGGWMQSRFVMVVCDCPFFFSTFGLYSILPFESFNPFMPLTTLSDQLWLPVNVFSPCIAPTCVRLAVSFQSLSSQILNLILITCLWSSLVGECRKMYPTIGLDCTRIQWWRWEPYPTIGPDCTRSWSHKKRVKRLKFGYH